MVALGKDAMIVSGAMTVPFLYRHSAKVPLLIFFFECPLPSAALGEAFAKPQGLCRVP
jgi:hypothetical protein